SDDDSPKGPGLPNVTLLFLGPRERSTIAIKLKVPRVTYILAKLAYPQGYFFKQLIEVYRPKYYRAIIIAREVPSYADSKKDREALQIRGCFAGSEGIANLAVAYKDYINPRVSPRLAKDMPNPFIDNSLQPSKNNN
ncbi:hypothetical protein L249_7304, partial [Ophiocordyceps polyrhachis-furcata BCC 54312]